MTDIIIHYRNELKAFLECEPSISYELSEEFSFFVKGYKFMPAYKAGRWDGKIRLYNIRDRLFYIGLLKNLIEWCRDNGYTIAYANKADFENSFTELTEDQWVELKAKGKFEPRWYQENAIKYALNHSKSLILSPTGSGKSYIMYLVVRHLLEYYDGDILIVVPSTGLVEQLEGDFKDYVADDWDVEENVHKLYGGKEKYLNKRVTISTWQTARLLPKSWFERFTAYICDEAHEADSKCQSAIIDQLAHARFRMGLTGTLDGTIMHLLEMQARFGSVYRVATTKDLQDEGSLSKLKIDCLQLKYSKEDVDLVRHLDYQQEIDFIVAHKKRNHLLAKAAIKCDGNVLMLFNYVNKHGVVLYEMLKPMCEKEGKKLYYISGKTHVDEREQIRSILEKEDNCILLASFGTTKRGVNFKNLDNMIFCHPFKSVTTILQSIGRQLRPSAKKQYATLIDIADDFSYHSKKGNKKLNTTLKHFLERLKIYAGEKWNYKIIKITM